MAFKQNDSTVQYDDNALDKTDIDTFQATFIPATIWLMTISLCGIFGNVFVLHIIRTNITLSSYKVFVVCIALIDLFACSVAIPIELILIFTHFAIDSSDGRMCKLSRCCNLFLSAFGSFVLVAVAIDRYIKVCRPFRTQISPSHAKAVCAILAVVGISVSWPPLFVFGKKTHIVVINGDRKMVTDCILLNKSSNYTPAVIFWVSLTLLCTVAMVIIVSFYCLICCKIKRHTLQQEERIKNNFGSESKVQEIEQPTLQEVKGANNKGRKPEEASVFVSIIETRESYKIDQAIGELADMCLTLDVDGIIRIVSLENLSDIKKTPDCSIALSTNKTESPDDSYQQSDVNSSGKHFYRVTPRSKQAKNQKKEDAKLVFHKNQNNNYVGKNNKNIVYCISYLHIKLFAHLSRIGTFGD